MARFNKSGGGRPSNSGPAPAPPLQIVEPRCSVCKSPHRRDVDRYLAIGLSQAEICRFFEALDGTVFTRKAMGTHKAKHLTLHTHAVRSIVEDEASEILHDIEDVKGFLITKKAILKIGLQKSFESIMSGEVIVEPEVMLKIIDKLEQWERETEAATIDEMKRDYNAFAAAVKQLVEYIAPQLSLSAQDLYERLYSSYEQALQDTAIPLVIRGMTMDMLPALDMPEDITDADFEPMGGGDEE